MTTKDYDHILKLLIIGDSGVGKSSLLLRFSDNVFRDQYISTIGIDFKIRTLEIDGERIRVQIWDTAGQERFRTITSTYYRGTHGVIVVYDVTNGESFVNVKRWLSEIEQNCDNIDRILVGNKNDRPDRKIVLTEDAQRFAEQMSLQLFETSAKNDSNVGEMFMAIIMTALQTKKASRTYSPPKPSIKLSKPKPMRKLKKKFCKFYILLTIFILFDLLLNVVARIF